MPEHPIDPPPKPPKPPTPKPKPPGYTAYLEAGNLRADALLIVLLLAGLLLLKLAGAL